MAEPKQGEQRFRDADKEDWDKLLRDLRDMQMQLTKLAQRVWELENP